MDRDMIDARGTQPIGRCRVSIIMPAYNAATTIADAIRSALGQTETRLELIIIDDASSDETLVIAQEFARQDDRVRILAIEHNGGPAAARNAGLAAAVGEWIALLDADDMYMLSRLARLLELAEANRADVVADNLLITTLEGLATPYLLLPENRLASPQWLTTAAFVAGNSGTSRTRHECYGFLQPLISRQFLSRYGIRYDARNRFGEDYLFYLKCLRAKARWWITPEALYHYRIMPNSLTSTQSSGDLWRISEAEKAFLADPEVLTDEALVAALKRHKSKIDRSYHYRAFTDAVKGRALDDAVEVLFHSSQSFWSVWREATIQAPTILRKAFAGGYMNTSDRSAAGRARA